MSRRSSNSSIALSLAAVAAGMLMLAYASVPLYRLFCEATGFGGAPRKAEVAPGRVASSVTFWPWHSVTGGPSSSASGVATTTVTASEAVQPFAPVTVTL